MLKYNPSPSNATRFVAFVGKDLFRMHVTFIRSFMEFTHYADGRNIQVDHNLFTTLQTNEVQEIPRNSLLYLNGPLRQCLYEHHL
jgi:hypothetical protein